MYFVYIYQLWPKDQCLLHTLSFDYIFHTVLTFENNSWNIIRRSNIIIVTTTENKKDTTWGIDLGCSLQSSISVEPNMISRYGALGSLNSRPNITCKINIRNTQCNITIATRTLCQIKLKITSIRWMIVHTWRGECELF